MGGSDDSNKPNPIDDLRKGLGLLFRAAKTTIEQLPTGKLEEAVVSGAKEVGRALENVAQNLEKQFHERTGTPKSEAPPAPKDEGRVTTQESPSDPTLKKQDEKQDTAPKANEQGPGAKTP